METVKDLYLNDKGFIFDPDSGAIYGLNKTGSFIIKELKKGLPLNRVLGEIRKHFEVDEGTARRDLREFLDLLAAFGLLAKAPA